MASFIRGGQRRYMVNRVGDPINPAVVRPPQHNGHGFLSRAVAPHATVKRAQYSIHKHQVGVGIAARVGARGGVGVGIAAIVVAVIVVARFTSRAPVHLRIGLTTIVATVTVTVTSDETSDAVVEVRGHQR